MMDFSRAKLSISSDKETGRTLLTQFLQTVAPSLSWQLLTGAGPPTAAMPPNSPPADTCKCLRIIELSQAWCDPTYA
jgi:hypothetical protein